jgi:hypothetical protein
MEFMKRARRLDPSSVDLILNSAEVHVLSNGLKGPDDHQQRNGSGVGFPAETAGLPSADDSVRSKDAGRVGAFSWTNPWAGQASFTLWGTTTSFATR